MTATSLWKRAQALTDESHLALLFRLWGYLEGNTPRFTEGLELFIPQLEEEEKRRQEEDK